jgi:hypothetical protein
LYIAQSIDGGASFPVQKIVQLTDSQLGDPPASDQFMPAITVDKFGGVNLLYFRRSVPAGDLALQYDVNYARIANFTVPLSGTIQVRRLTPRFNPVPVTGGTLGHYLMMDHSGCEVWVAYPRADNVLGVCDVFVQHINISAADVTDDADVTPIDMAAFVNALSAGDPSADLNHDGILNAIDVQTFVTAYSCGCGTP